MRIPRLPWFGAVRSGPELNASTDLTGRVVLTGLPEGAEIFYRARCDGRAVAAGRLRTASRKARDVRFFWSGDTAGQGWGINLETGGMTIYDTMRRLRPDFFLHSGDTIYADNPILPEVKLADGRTWRNVTTAAKSRVAKTLTDFRGNYQYNFLDEHVRAFSAEVPQIWQWDDHEVANNWSPGKGMEDLVAAGRQAFLEYARMRPGGGIYRRIGYGPLLADLTRPTGRRRASRTSAPDNCGGYRGN